MEYQTAGFWDSIGNFALWVIGILLALKGIHFVYGQVFYIYPLIKRRNKAMEGYYSSESRLIDFAKEMDIEIYGSPQNYDYENSIDFREKNLDGVAQVHRGENYEAQKQKYLELRQLLGETLNYWNKARRMDQDYEKLDEKYDF